MNEKEDEDVLCEVVGYVNGARLQKMLVLVVIKDSDGSTMGRKFYGARAWYVADAFINLFWSKLVNATEAPL